MRTEEGLSVIANQTPEDVTREILEGIDLICESAWQNASPLIRRRYPRFDRTSMEYGVRHQLREALPEQYPSFEEAMCALDEIVPIVETGSSPDLTSAKDAGRTLRFASYGGCMFGGKASYGDLLMCMRAAHTIPVYEEHLKHHYDPCLAFKNRDFGTVTIFLNACLGYSLDTLEDLGIKDEAPSVFYYEEEADVWLPDLQVIGAGYHFYSSLLEYTELPPGNA